MRFFCRAALFRGCAALVALTQLPHPAATIANLSPLQDARAPGLVFDSAQQRGEGDTLLLAVCVANLGSTRITDVSIDIETLDVNGADPAVILASATAWPGELSGRRASMRVDVLGAGEMQQIDLLLRADAAVADAQLRVAVRAAHRLSGAVRLDCQPRGVAAAPPAIAQPARMQSDGQPLALRDAIARLQADGVQTSPDDGAAARASAASAAVLSLLAGFVLLGLLSAGALALQRALDAGR
jgi:hypothetical protein